ncbi:TPA: Mu-like prophage major head subunit gpT family protein [Acinetobacter baumannii]|jgi:phage major head subunit gpT-like protein|uniref:Mu-like prophage major head subunit gpT family protein n=1 Tax=Acinetobacter baumannii TaxID=470 RepID=UPI0004499B54|nr:Mu-like prophage major head subunit gpT family protein [Acinetobacter baumannii]EXS24383.1 mu-like prophage major head subunit gpT family protein [Acinetobacter baumannii 573719]KCY20097.1 mu-like prophage major head subunit gpT family protein [Acinetobacter baumannii 233846]MBD0530172.1 head protein [Acinetobacter baumannii]MBJ9444434.1 Mu-like prophage major head subunit gpT family protein [Acinetobacter baumannii]MCJ9204079.1 Mu-like prophage major head subunit gpT family protein [Acinet
MIVNGANLNAIFLNLSKAFNLTFNDTQVEYPDIAMVIPSNGAYQDYRWLSNFPQMKEWVGKKNIAKLSEYDYVIRNKNYEATIEVLRDNIEDDQLGIYKPQAESAAWSAKQHPDEIVFEAANAVFTAKCYDGQPMVSNNHKVGKTTVSNKGTKKLSIASQEAARASFGAARTAMRKFKDEEGRPLNITPNLLLVPPALEDIANALMTNAQLEDGKPNPYKGTAKVKVSTRLTDDNAWFLLDTTKPVKPFVYQQRKKPVFVQMTSMDSPNVFMEGVFYFGVEARGAGGYGFWQTIYGSTGTEA